MNPIPQLPRSTMSFLQSIRLPVAIMMIVASSTSLAADLVVEVEGLRSRKGSIAVGLFDKAELFPRTIAQGQRVSADKEVVELVFRDLKPGIYALSAYQDENDNRQLDRGMFGVPKEPYGFSRDAQGDMGPPEFRDARIEVTESGLRTRIRMR